MPGDFTDLIAWQQAVELAADVARLVPSLRGLGAGAAAEQLRRAAESIPANIAEGYGRGFGRDNARFLRIASASAAEVESHLRVAIATGRIRQNVAAGPIGRCRRVRALLRGLYLKVVGTTERRVRGPLTQP